MRISYLIKKTATFKMLFLCLTLLLSVVFTNQSYAQLTGVKTIPSVNYPTVKVAFDSLNLYGVAGGGGVTFDIAAGYTETIAATLSLTATGTALDQIVFQKSGTGANPLITAYTGGTATPATVGAPLDGIVRLVGSDWVTFDGISLQENAANTTGTAFMEYGLAFYKTSGTNGCNSNTIKNCVITLNRNNIATGSTETEIGSTGIFTGNATFNNPSVALTVTSASGTNSNNKFYSDTIQNCNVGISMRGFTDAVAPFAFYDQNIDIGGIAPATGNFIIDFGGGLGAGSSNTVNGIKSVNANAVNISYNIVRSSTGVLAPTANAQGIFTSSPNAALTTINNNTVTLQIGTNSSFLVALAIDCSNGSVVSAGVVNMNSNTITNCIVAAGTNPGNNGPMTGMRVASQPATVNMNNNLIYGDTMYNVGTFNGMIYSGTNLSAVVSVSNNQIYNIHKVNNNPAASGGGNNLIGITAAYGQTTINNNVIHDFTIINIVNTMNCKADGILIGAQGVGTSMSITNNQVYNLFTTGTSTSTSQTVTNGIETNNSGLVSSNLTISGNTFYNFNSTNTALTGAGVLIRGMEVSTALTINVFNNKMYDFTCTGLASAIVGYRVVTGQNVSIYNNYIGNFFTPTATTATTNEQIIGISDEGTLAGQNHNFYYNTIYLSGTSSGTNFGSSAVKTNVVPNTTMRNNIFINATTPKGSGIAAAHRRTSTSLATYMSASNNNIFYATTPLSVAKNIYYDGTNSDLTLAAYKTRVAGRDNASASELTPFLNTVTGASANYLHVDPTVATAAESGGTNISGITNDFDADIRQGNGGYVGTGTAPDIGADEFGGILNDVTPPAIAAGTVLGACGTGDRTISGVVITDATGVPTTLLDPLLPRIYYRKSGTIPYFSKPGTLVSGTATNGTWDFTIVAADMGALAVGNTVEYYFIAQDVVGTPNISSVPFGAVATDVNTITTPPTIVSSYTILNSLNGTYTVGAGGNYTTLTLAVAAYNTSCLSGPVVFSLTDANYVSETLPIIINANPFASATNTLTIKPATGNVKIEGTATSTSVIALLGADYITIQGSASPVTNTVCPLVRSTRNLTILNKNVGSTQNCVVFVASNSFDGATNNKIINCNITGGALALPFLFTNTGIGFGAGPIATGFGTGTGSFGYNNSNNVVENNSIGNVAYGIISQGFNFAIKNQNNVYNLNEMSGTGFNGIFRYGIFLGNENNVSITGNIIKNVIGQSTGTDIVAINLGNPNGIAMNGFGTNEVTNAVITKNVIDNIQSFATIGGQSAVGIATSSSPSGFITSGTNLISNNMISGVVANSNGAQDLSCGLMIGNQVGLTTQLYDNTVNMNADGFATNVATNLALFVGGGSAIIPIMDIKNNILVNTIRLGTGNNFVMGLQIPGVAGNYLNLLSDNNDMYVSNAGGFFNAIGVVGTGANPSINPGTNNFPTLAAWQAQTGRDANSKNVLPVFVSTTNPHLVNTAAVNFNLNGTGVVLAAVTDDIDCEPRTGASSPDMGADEFSAPPVDLAFDAIKPTANTTCHSANEPIIVTVRNTGSTTIDMSLDTIFVSTTYSGTISGTSIDTVYTGTLAPNATVDVTLEPTINTTSNGSYTFTTAITPIAGEGFTTNNNNVTSITINNTPVAVAASVFNNNLCLGYSTPITAAATFGTLPYTYAWTPATGLNSTNVASVTAAPVSTTTYTVTVTDGCGNTISATALVNITIPGVQSAPSNTRCGVGPITLTATPEPGSTINWYNAATGSTIAATGNTYTPIISATTTYYVSATSGSAPYYVGLTDLSPLNGAVTFGAGAGRGQMITANKPGAITGCIVYPSNAATIISAMSGGLTQPIQICLRARGSAVNIAKVGSFQFTLAQLGTPVQLNFNLPITTPGDYQLVYDTIGGINLQNTVGLAQYSFSYTGTYPLSTADGSLVMPGGAFNTTNATVQATTYNAFWNVQYTTYCESARQPVQALFTPTPVLTISANRNICIGDTVAISVTSNVADYDSYVWTPTNIPFYTDPACSTLYVPGSSANPIYYVGYAANTATFTCNASNAALCANVATSTIITQPALTSISANTYGICGSGTAVLSLTPTTGFGTGAILWESSIDSSNWTPFGGSTTTITSPVISQTTYFRARVLNTNAAVCSELGLAPIKVYNSSVTSAPGVTRCGVGTVNLKATVSAGATTVWYTSPTSQPALLVGDSVTSPQIAGNTTYYVAAREGSQTYGIGVPEASSTYGSVFVFSGVSGPVTPDKPLWITVVKPGVLDKLTVYPIAEGTVTISLRLRGSAADILTSSTFTISAGQVSTAVELPVNMTFTTPGIYQITNLGVGCAVLSPYNGAAGAYPFSAADGSLLINGSANNSTSVSAPTSGYNAMFNLKYTTACESARQAVLVTVTPPPAFTTNVVADTACNQTPRMLNVTSTNSNYTTYTWAPANFLYTDAAGTIPYVLGANEDTVYSNPANAIVYIATATDTISGCSDTNKITVTPIYLLPELAANANLTEVCGTGSVLINVIGVYNSNLATYLWESSPDSSVWSPVPGATSISLLTPVLSSTTYFRCNVYCSGSLISNAAAIKINVNNPLILTTLADTVCGSGSPTLMATATAGSVINWWSAASGGFNLGTGNSFTTPSLTATTNFYAEASTGTYSEPVGLNVPNLGGGGNLFPGRGLQFSTTKQLIINSVTLSMINDGTTSSFVDIALQDATGTEITSTGIINGIVPGSNVIPVNFSVPVGTGYKLVVKSGGGGFFENSNPVSYPLNSFSGAMSITAGLNVAIVPSVYYLFYNISISAGCYSPRVPVEAFVKPTVPVTITTANTTVCAGSNVTLSASSAFDPNYSYSWLPDGQTGASVTVVPTTSTIYTVVATNTVPGPDFGCQTIQTIAISIIPAIPAFTVTPDNFALCTGSSVNISANLPPLGGSGVFGTDTLLANQPTNYPAPYGELYESTKHQILILASELAAKGLTAGSEIKSLAFSVQSVGAAGIMNGFRIQIAKTNVSNLTTWITSGLTPVFGPVNYQPVVGSNMHTFSSAFVWDGTSNIIVQTCFSNDPTGISNAGTANAIMNRTATGFNSVLYANFNDLDVCPLNASLNVSALRPNMTLGFDKTVSYAWSPATGLNSTSVAAVVANPTSSTIYTVTITNTLFGCSASSTSSITVNQLLKPYLNIGDTVLCSNVPIIEIVVLDSGAYSPANGGYPAGTSFNWGNTSSDDNDTIAIQQSSNASVTVTLPPNLGGCSATTATSIIDLGSIQPPVTYFQVDSVDCNGQSSGMIIGYIDTANAGTPNYHWQWYSSPGNVLLRDVTNSALADTLQGLPVGNYYLVLTDHIGQANPPYCITDIEVQNLFEPAMLMSTENVGVHVDLVCNGIATGVAGVSTTGGTLPYTYLWSNGGTTATISNILAGTYCVTVTDAHGCTATMCAVLIQPTVIVPNATGTNVSCNGESNGSASSAPTGGTGMYSYMWSNGSTNVSISGLIAGTYTVTIMDENGCTKSAAYTVTQPDALTAICSSTTITCFNGSDGTATAIPVGGTAAYSYLWSNGSTNVTITGLLIGIYTVTVTDAQNCITSASVTVAQNPLVVPTITGNGFNCQGGSTVLSTGVYAAYSWSTGASTQSVTVSPASATTYSVTVTNELGCTGTATKKLTITLPPATPGIISGPTEVCKPNTVTYMVAAVANATSYNWTVGAGATITGGAGTNVITVSFSNSATNGNVKVNASNVCFTSNDAVLAYVISGSIPNKPTLMSGSFYGNCNITNSVYTCSTVGAATSYFWTVPAGVSILSGQNTNSIVVKYGNGFTNTGTIAVQAVNACGSSAPLTRSTSARLNTPVISGPNSACKNDIKTYTVLPIVGATSYTWTVVAGSTILSGQGTTSMTVKWGNASGVIKCAAINACGASVKGNYSVSTVCPKVAGSAFDLSELNLFPNPAATFTTVQFDGYAEGKGQLYVFDLVGQQVLYQDLSVAVGDNRYQIDLNSFPKGLYSIRVVYNGLTRNQKLIVQ